MAATGLSGLGCPLQRSATARRPFQSLQRPCRARRAPTVWADISQVTPETLDAVQTSASAVSDSVIVGGQQLSPAAIGAGIAAAGEMRMHACTMPPPQVTPHPHHTGCKMVYVVQFVVWDVK